MENRSKQGSAFLAAIGFVGATLSILALLIDTHIIKFL